MKLIPLIGALLLSTAPVQAIETYEELVKTCRATVEIANICAGVGDFGGAAAMVSLLCDLEEKGRISTENLVLTWDEWKGASESPMWKTSAEIIIKKFPECSIKP